MRIAREFLIHILSAADGFRHIFEANTFTTGEMPHFGHIIVIAYMMPRRTPRRFRDYAPRAEISMRRCHARASV